MSSCTVEVAKKEDTQTLTIYSDCLSKRDIKLFSKFQKEEKIKVTVYNMHTIIDYETLEKQLIEVINNI